MIAPGAGVRVYLACGVTDMRKGIEGLAAIAQDVLARIAAIPQGQLAELLPWNWRTRSITAIAA